VLLDQRPHAIEHIAIFYGMALHVAPIRIPRS
jgi:hypothetical protein